MADRDEERGDRSEDGAARPVSGWWLLGCLLAFPFVIVAAVTLVVTLALTGGVATFVILTKVVEVLAGGGA